MKKIILNFGICILLILGCSNGNEDNSIVPTEYGKIQLAIDKENAPAEVVLVELTLTSTIHNPIFGTMDLLSDSTAKITISDIMVGVWHLKVDAKDIDNVVLYTGETDVEIFAGFTTQVYLTLNPTGQGTGSIYIYVTWGINTSLNWIDFSDNPILQSSGNYWDLEGVHQPMVLFDDNIFKMYYSGHAGAGSSYAAYAESIDGINWDNYNLNPILSPGEQGSWDDHSVVAHSIIFEDGLYKLYYIGWSDNWGNWHLGLATSTDGLNWTKYPNPVLYATSGWEYQIASASVIKFEGTYYLFYTGRNLPYVSIGLATSVDGVNWTRYSGNPILTNTEPWESDGVYCPSVVRENNVFKMVYMNSSGTGFGFAYSTNGTHWTKDESNPFFVKENTSNDWASFKIAYPFYLELPNEYRIYYCGMENAEPFWRIGFARKFLQ